MWSPCPSKHIAPDEGPLHLMQDETQHEQPIFHSLRFVNRTCSRFFWRPQCTFRARKTLLRNHAHAKRGAQRRVSPVFFYQLRLVLRICSERFDRACCDADTRTSAASQTGCFSTISVPTDTERRRDLLPFADPDAPVPEWSKKLDELDQRLYADPDGLNARLERFARQNALVSAKDDQ